MIPKNSLRASAFAALAAVKASADAKEKMRKVTAWAERENALTEALVYAFGHAEGDTKRPALEVERQRLLDVERIIAQGEGFLWWTERIPGFVGERLVMAQRDESGRLGHTAAGQTHYFVGFVVCERGGGLLKVGELLDAFEQGPLLTVMSRHSYRCACLNITSLSHLVTEVAALVARTG